MGWSKDPGPSAAGMFPAFFVPRKKEYRVFVDESGDFGPVNCDSPFYIVSLVFHEQSNEINSLINELDESLSVFPMKDHLIHSGPIIRNEENYSYLPLGQRRKDCPDIVWKMFG